MDCISCNKSIPPDMRAHIRESTEGLKFICDKCYTLSAEQHRELIEITNKDNKIKGVKK